MGPGKFKPFGAQAMTYTAGMEGVKRWAGGAQSGVGQHSKEYVPMAVYARQAVQAQLPDYVKQLERERKMAAADAGMKAFKEYPYTPMTGGVLGVSEAAEAASRKARNDARDSASAEAAAHGVVIDLALLQRQAAAGRQRSERGLGVLAWNPGFCEGRRDAHGAVHRLQAGMRHKGQ